MFEENVVEIKPVAKESVDDGQTLAAEPKFDVDLTNPETNSTYKSMKSESEPSYHGAEPSLELESTSDPEPSTEPSTEPELSVEPEPSKLDELEAAWINNMTELNDVVTGTFDDADRDSNGYLTKTESIDAYNESKSPHERQVFRAIFENIDALSGLSDDEMFFEWSGASQKDLGRLTEVENEFLEMVRHSSMGREFLIRDFGIADADGNGRVNLPELELYKADATPGSQKEQSLNYVKDHFTELYTDAHGNGVVDPQEGLSAEALAMPVNDLILSVVTSTFDDLKIGYGVK